MTTRRGHGEGSIYWDEARRRWVGQIDLGVDLNGKRRRPKVFGKTKTEVRRKMAELQRRACDGLPVGSADRLGPFLDWWLGTLEAKAASGTKSLNTVDNARWACGWIVPALGSRRLRELEPDDVEALLTRMATVGRSRRSILRVRSYLGQALAVAERRGKVSRNVAKLAEMPETKPPTEGRSLTHVQAHVLLEAAKGNRLEALYITGLMMGLRPGELTGLRWSSRDADGNAIPGVDLDAGLLLVDKSMKIERGKLRLGETKTDVSGRTLTIPAPVMVALRAHRKRQLEDRLRAGSAWQETRLVFTTSIGTAMNPANLRRSFRSLTTRAGLGHWTPNELRHTAASLMCHARIPLEVAADVLGHTDTRMLMKVYRHNLQPSLDGHVKVMDGLFGNP